MPDKEEWINNGWGKAYADMPATTLWEFGFGTRNLCSYGWQFIRGYKAYGRI